MASIIKSQTKKSSKKSSTETRKKVTAPLPVIRPIPPPKQVERASEKKISPPTPQIATSAGGLPTPQQLQVAVDRQQQIENINRTNAQFDVTTVMPGTAQSIQRAQRLAMAQQNVQYRPATGSTMTPARQSMGTYTQPLSSYGNYAPGSSTQAAISAYSTQPQSSLSNLRGYGQSVAGSLVNPTVSGSTMVSNLRQAGVGSYAPTGQTLGAQQTGNYATPQQQYTMGTSVSPLWGKDYGSSIASESSIAKLLGATVVENDNDPINLTASVSRGADAAGNIILNDNDLIWAARLTQDAIMHGQVPNKMSVDVAMHLTWPRKETDYSFRIYGRTFDSAQDWLDFMNYQYDPSTGWYVYTEPTQVTSGYGGGGYGGSGGYSRYSGGSSGGRTSSGGSGYGGNYGLVNWRI